MKNHIATSLSPSRIVNILSIAFLFIFMTLSPFAAYAQMDEADNGIAWLVENQNLSGSWGEGGNAEYRDTAVVIKVLQAFSQFGTVYNNGINYIENEAVLNNDYLAKKIEVLAQDGSDVSSLIDEMITYQNPEETDDTYYNSPEGGWGPADGYSTDCLDTLMALEALADSKIPNGFMVVEKTIAEGEIQEFNFEYPEDTADFEIFVAEVSGGITFRLFPYDSSVYYSWGTISSTTYLNTTGISIETGTRRIQIIGDAESTYSLKMSLTSEGYNSDVLVNPLTYLLEAQNSDGGWGLSIGSDSNVFLTARVLKTLHAYSDVYELESAIQNGIVWLKSQQNVDNGFGAGESSVYETAAAYIAMALDDLSSTEAENALAYILSTQQIDGSWNNKAYDTAISLLAIYTSMLETDSDEDGVADVFDNCPDEANADQLDTDGDLSGDVCDDDDDGDGLTDEYEINFTGTNPLLADTDGDGIPDGLEDSDFDGVNNSEEAEQGSDPKLPDISLSTGFNLLGYPVEIPEGYTSFDLIYELGDELEVEKIQHYDTATGVFETTIYNSGVPDGDEFDIINGEGYIVYMYTDKTVTFDGNIICPSISLADGLNIISVPCFPDGLTSYDLLNYLGIPAEIASVQRYNQQKGAFETTAFYNGIASGVMFEIVNGEAYLVNTRGDKTAPALLDTPIINITTPSDLEVLSSTPIDVTGTVSDSSAFVTVNDVTAVVSSGTYTASGVPLTSGENTITAMAVSPNNLVGSQTITVTLDQGIDYEISIGSSVSDSRSFQGDETLLDQTAYFTESQIGVPSEITYTTTGVVRTSETDIQITFTIQVSSSAETGIYEFQIEYGLLDSDGNPLTPLSNNIFSFKIMVVS